MVFTAENSKGEFKQMSCKSADVNASENLFRILDR